MEEWAKGLGGEGLATWEQLSQKMGLEQIDLETFLQSLPERLEKLKKL